MIAHIYRGLTTAAGPAILWYLRRRLARGKEDPARFAERLGRSTRARPPGPLLWCHGASVGETMAALPLLHRLAMERPELGLLVTSGTMTAAAMLADRLPAGAQHAYIPADRPAWVRRFLDHWRPDAALWMESELWPNLVAETARRDIPMALLNGRLSARSHRNWRRFGRWAAAIIGPFAPILVPDAVQAARFASLGGRDVRVVGNLKAAAMLGEADPAALAAARASIGRRPCWLAVSTHPGEDELVLAAHARLRAGCPDLLLVLVPRHPQRGADVAALAAAAGLPAVLRTGGDAVGPDTAVLVGDTLGEMALYLRLADIVLVAGSFDVGRGGHNPLEPALVGAAILHGPDMANFAGVAERLRQADATLPVADAGSLAAAVARLLADPAERSRRGQAARRVAGEEAGALDRTMEALAPLLDRLSDTGGAVRAGA
ncbi:3-deoxy-D-manno-octulosonic-acid transferase [Stella humosa]|uniref:3-deoxy-D-manno-octulosonic acid transferase n=1 Tax=Stella humosa TaxID=94 RepID=A0A3N1LPJ3_9PROT|nr:3-deoxy-D-manno-octulosonic acid transferase [Stella humosa]ROP91135.1 3-deoxy-D-manno-octulosonic-acid transferase [Stella humosa]BBK34513.1 3-deoxy-D-manno-octulosonic acid transferase [Stella humosa]